MQVLMGVEGFLEPLLCSEGSDRPQALKGRRQVGEDWTPSCREEEKEISTHTLFFFNIFVLSMHSRWS